MNTHNVVSLPVAADLSSYSDVAVKLTSTGINLAGPGDRIIGTMIRGNNAPAIGQVVGTNFSPAADVFLVGSNGFNNITIGSNAAINVADFLEQGANGTIQKQSSRTGTYVQSGNLGTATAHGLAVGQPVQFSVLTTSGGTGLQAGVTYYVVAVPTANTYQVSAVPGGAAVTIGTADYTVATLTTQVVGQAIDSAPANSAGGVIQAILFTTPASTGAGSTVTSTGTGSFVLATSPTLVTPNIGVATGSGLLLSSPTGSLGFATGAGGAVTQITSSATGVTINKPTGQISTVALTTAAAGHERFTVTNSQVAATDTIDLSTTYAGAGTPLLSVAKVVGGAFDIIIYNADASAALNALMVLNFTVNKGVAS